MSAFSTEEIVESFKFLPRFNLDRLLLVCRQWNQLIKRFERHLSVRRLMVRCEIYSTYTTVEIELTKVIHPIDSWLNNVSANHLSVSESLKYSHPEKQEICPEGPHKQLYSFLDSHLRNSAVSLSLTDDLPPNATRTPPGLLRLIKDLVEGQLQRNCSIICVYRMKWENVLNYDISNSKLGKATLLPSDHSLTLIQPIRDANGIGPYMALVDHCKIVFPIANRLLKPAPELTVTSHFHHNFPEQFIEIFKNSRKDDWPKKIVVNLIGKTRPRSWTGEYLHGHSVYTSIPKSVERRDRSLLEHIWPNAKEICPDLRKRPMKIVHPNTKDGRRLTIEFAMNLATPEESWSKNYDCSFTFKTTSTVPKPKN
ncbi:hypothetical protein Ddc_16118 [Ditylenchus destructor]|nr:hypothetical protein Ddc_16118 [Ditylenchus destructor]